jgi:hypothetical protein
MMYIFAVMHVMGPFTFFKDSAALWLPLLHNIAEAAVRPLSIFNPQHCQLPSDTRHLVAQLVFASPYYIYAATQAGGVITNLRWFVELPGPSYPFSPPLIQLLYTLY